MQGSGMTPEFRRSFLFWAGLPLRAIIGAAFLLVGCLLFVDDWDELYNFCKSIVKGRPSL